MSFIIIIESYRFYNFTLKNFEESISSSFSQITEIITYPLWTVDYNYLEKIASTYIDNPFVKAIEINDNKNNLILSFNNFEVLNKGSLIIKERDIFFQNYSVGNLKVWYSSNELLLSYRYNLYFTIFIWFLGILIIIVIIRLFINRFFSNSLNNLFTIMDNISDGNFNINTNLVHYHELEKVLNKFIQISKKLKNREWEIKKNNIDLSIANEAKTILLSKVSHELRTPLNGILAGSEMGLLSKDISQKDEYLNIILGSGKRLLPIIDDILDISNLENKKLIFEEDHFFLPDLLIDIFKTNETEAIKKGLEFKYVIDEKLNKFFIGDEKRINQILNNIITNAIKFTHIGNIFIKANLINEYTDSSNSYCTILFSVKDTGIGIENEKLDNIFEPFIQSEKYITRKFGGAGLGLSITKQLVKKMDGDIWVNSKYNEGSEFFIRINLKNSLRNSYNKSSKIIMNNTKQRLNILIGENDLISIKIIENIMKELKHTFTIVKNGKDLLLKYNENNFDIIFINIYIPEIDIFSVVNIIKQKERKFDNKTTVIAILEYNFSEEKNNCVDAGIDDFIIKPYNINNFIDIINHYGNKKRSFDN